MTRIIYALPLLVMAALAVLYVMSLHKDENTQIMHKPAPSFSMPIFGEEGKTFTQDNLKGGIKIVNFFATWCPACVYEYPQLKTLSEQHRLPIYAIAYKDDEVDLKRFLENYGNPFDLIGFDKGGDAYIAWGVTGMPESYIIDTNGNIRYRHTGIITKTDIDKKILPLIETLRKETP